MNYVGVGGTITSLAAIKKQLSVYQREDINGTILTVSELKAYYKSMSSQSPAELRRQYPLLRDRADIITEGILLYLYLAELLNFQQITVSDCGLLDGLILME